MTDELLAVEHLYAGYAGVPVVRDLNLTVGTGEVVALLGPNGAGKTTTLLTISALLPIIEGQVRVFGSSIKKRSASDLARAGVGHVTEDRSLFYELTVKENLRLGCHGRRADLEMVLGFFPQLRALLGRRAGLLSGGEQQMLALARAVGARPRLLLLDEMSLGLAPVIVERLMPILRRLADEQGLTILMVEQHVQIALEVADRAYVVAHGDLVLEDRAATLLADKAMLEASYMGDAGI